MNIIWKGIDGKVKPDGVTILLNEQKVIVQNSNESNLVFLNFKLAKFFFSKEKYGKNFESLLADTISIIGKF